MEKGHLRDLRVFYIYKTDIDNEGVQELAQAAERGYTCNLEELSLAWDIELHWAGDGRRNGKCRQKLALPTVLSRRTCEPRRGTVEHARYRPSAARIGKVGAEHHRR